MSDRILVAEDEEILRINLCEFLSRSGYEVTGAEDGEAALDLARQQDFDLVLTDIRMPRLDGIGLLKHLIAERPETLVLITTAYASVETAIEALRFGAYDYLLKPIVFEDLLQKIQNLLEYRALKAEVVRLRQALRLTQGYEGMVGDGPAMRQIFDLVDKVAPTRSTVLVTGASGTGKELVARAIHARSQDSEREFLAVNMAAMPREMIEAQLFGHEKGAFTGADQAREGIFRTARGGTVFLDEIAEMPVETQAKLLRALESHEVLPVGADRPVKVDFRLVAATNQDLQQEVEAGHFRSDLFFRLNVFRIALPALNARPEDIPALVEHFAVMHAAAQGKKPPAIENEVMRRLLGYPWPGNVRELSNVIERACILAGNGPITVEHLPSEFDTEEEPSLSLKRAVEDFERRHVAFVVRAAGGNRERAARMLEVDPATLYRRLAKYGLH